MSHRLYATTRRLAQELPVAELPSDNKAFQPSGTTGPADTDRAAPTSTPLDALIAKWRRQADRERKFDGPLGGKAIGRGIGGLLDRCADELQDALAASPASALVTRTERLDDLRTIAAFAMAQGEDDVENAGIRVMLALDHPELLAASTASQPTSTPLDALRLCGCGDEPNERDCIAPDGILANGYVCQRLGTGRDRA
jgi:hypothetical protein